MFYKPFHHRLLWLSPYWQELSPGFWTLMVSKGTSCLKIFHPFHTLASATASASPSALSLSPFYHYKCTSTHYVCLGKWWPWPHYRCMVGWTHTDWVTSHRHYTAHRESKITVSRRLLFKHGNQVISNWR